MDASNDFLRQVQREAEDDAGSAAHLEIADARPPEFSDEGLAQRFAVKHAGDVRYIAVWNKWLIWSGSRWAFDTTLRAFDMSRNICRVASSEAADKIATAIASAKTVAAVTSLARADRRLAATVEQWDADAWLLNTPDDVIDLRTGLTSPSDPLLYITKMTACPAGGDCPLWLEFLNRVTNGDRELQTFLQRIVGYSLTGSIREHALFFLYGLGANGKGVFVNTINEILGDYAATAPMQTFIASANEQHPTDLAGLRGARLVTAQETEQGRRWAESKIKALTGGDPISARFMRQDFFTFTPQFKLVIAGNHKPGLRSVDEAVRRRFNLIPFTVTIPAAERDLQLPEKLRAEWSGILQWAIDGCLEWQRVGLSPPATVLSATKAYLTSEDALSEWISERCCVDQAYTERSGKLFASWKSWAETAGEFVGSQKRLIQAFEDRKFERAREGGTGQRLVRGIALKPDGENLL